MFFGRVDVPALQLGPQRFLLGYQVADDGEGVVVGRFTAVGHRSSVPDSRRGESVGCISPGTRAGPGE